MRRPVLVALTLLLVLSAFASTSPVSSMDNKIAPRVIDTTPARGEELPIDSPITLYFDQPMDHASVEAAFSVTPSVKGTFTWSDDLTVQFQPSSMLQRATAYAFTLTSTAQSQANVPLADTFTIKLNTTGLLEVVQVLPADKAANVEQKTTITVFFNRPIVPLVLNEDTAKLPTPIQINPQISGTGQWLNTSIYTFKPDSDLKAQTKYTVIVNKGLTDVTGSVLPQDYIFSFTTFTPPPPKPPAIISFYPGNKSTGIARDDTFTVNFSTAMDKAATENAFSMHGPDNLSIGGEFTWNERDDALTFKPSVLLDYATSYTIKIDHTIARSKAGLQIASDEVNTFKTVDLPDLVDTGPKDGEFIVPFTGLRFIFSAPMKLDDFKTRLTIEPKPKVDTLDGTPSYDSRQYDVAVDTLPSTSYTITIDVNGLLDSYDTPFKPNPASKIYKIISPGKLQIKFITAALSAEASLQTENDIGLYSAYSNPVRVYTIHRNISTVSLSLWSLKLNDFLKMISPNGYDLKNKYVPQDLLRRWSIPLYNPSNRNRYDLLAISDHGDSVGQKSNIQCIEAGPTRLDIGNNIVVLKNDPKDPYRLRNEAGLTGAIIAQVNAGTEFKVIDGPICADRFVWWKLASKDGTLEGWGAESDRAAYYIGPAAATAAAPTVTPTAQTDANQPSLKPGVYWLEFTSQEIPNNNSPLKHIMLVATVNITFKVTETEFFAWVTDLKTGKPVPNAHVIFLTGADPQIFGAALTDKDGIARIAAPTNRVGRVSRYQDASYAVVNEANNFGVGSSNWASGIDPGDFGQPGNFQPTQFQVYLYTDKPIYRPGQPVYFRGVLRIQNDVTYTLSTLKAVNVQILSSDNKSIYQEEVPLTDYGTFADSVKLDANAALGGYRVVVRPSYIPDAKTNADKQFNESLLSYDYSFNVAEYRAPEFQVKLTAEQPQVVQGDKVRVTVDSSFFFGGPVSHASVTWTVVTNNYYFGYTGTGNYSFVDFNEDDSPYRQSNNPYGDEIANGTGKTDDQGKFTIELPADLSKVTQSQMLTIEASVADESNRLVGGRTNVIINEGQFYLGVGSEDYVSAANKPEKINVIAVDWNSHPLPKTPISLRVVERVWNSVQTVEPGTGRIIWETDVKENQITATTVTTDGDGKAAYNFIPPHGGIYKVYVTSRDTKGNQVTSSAFMWVAGPDYVPWRQENSNRIELKIDRSSYKVGQTASILIASPFQGQATALITIERGTILKSEIVTLPNNSTVYKLPITPDMAPDAFVSVMIVKGVDSTNPVADFRMGLIQLNVETDHLNLNISVTPDKQQAGPRDTITYKLHVTDFKGDPVRAEVGVGLVDAAVLSLQADPSQPLINFFYGQQALAIRTSTSLIMSVDQQTQQIINTVKGGGGGGGESGIFDIRQEFVDTPLWMPAVETDIDGNATVTVKLPDNLTTWHLDVRAVTNPIGELKTTLVGQTTNDLISTKPLLIRPETPRFYVIGDKSVLAAVVNNNTHGAQQVKVRVDVKGLTISGDIEKVTTMAALSRTRFEWPVEVQNVDTVEATFTVSTVDNQYADVIKVGTGEGDNRTIPVNHYEAPDIVGTGGVIDKAGGDRTEGIVLPRNASTQQGSLNIRIDHSLAASTTDALTVLKYYPYYCLEQTVSRFLPNLATYGALNKLGIANDALREEAKTTLGLAIQRIYSEQHPDGGWGWFVNDGSNTLTTAYALIGLSEARKQGFDIDQSTLDRAVNFLQSTLAAINKDSDIWQLNRQTFILYALARAGKPNTSEPDHLFEFREKLGYFGRAYLAMTYNLINKDDHYHLDPLISDFQNRVIASATGAHWEESYPDYWNWNTDTRTTALVLMAMVQIQPSNPLLPNVVRWLMVARKDAGWSTTQETAWSIMALTDWMQYTGELKPTYSFGLSINGKPLGDRQTTSPATERDTLNLQVAVKDLIAGRVNQLTIDRSVGDGTLYYTAHLITYLPVEQIKPVTRGISITRSYSQLYDQARKPITQAHVGDNIRVTLTIIAPSDLHYVVITDPIPAGTESIDTSLLTTNTVGIAPGVSLTNPLDQGWGWWWFSKVDLHDDRTELYATYLPRGTYEFSYTIRAGVVGEYHVIPASGKEFYFPEVFGRSEGSMFTLLPVTATKTAAQ